MENKKEQANNLLFLSTTYGKGSKLNKVYKQLSRKTYIEAYKNKQIGLIQLVIKLCKAI
jgi:hypothetical protein